MDRGSDLVPGANRVHCVLTNVRQEASVRLVVSRPGETLIEAEFNDGSAPGGIVYDESFGIEAEVE